MPQNTSVHDERLMLISESVFMMKIKKKKKSFVHIYHHNVGTQDVSFRSNYVSNLNSKGF